jgi:hypothetical protein
VRCYVRHLLSGAAGGVIAFVGTLVLLYFQFLQVGSIELATSSPLVKSLADADSPLTFALTVTVTNTGGRGKCLWDLALRVKAISIETKWAYFPAFVLDYRRYLALMEHARSFEPALVQPFTPPADLWTNGSQSVIPVLTKAPNRRTYACSSRPRLSTPRTVHAIAPLEGRRRAA